MVVYFSGTGNSRYAAETLGLRLGDKLVSSNEYIKEGKATALFSETPYVFVSPTYSWRIPRVFSDFIKNGKFEGSSSAYFVMTCGDDIGNAGAYLKQLCEEKGFKYMGVSAVVMPENYVAVFDVTPENEIDAIMKEADMRLRSIAELLSSASAFPEEKHGVLDSFKSKCINPIFYKSVVKSKDFHVTDKCISCGRCEELCPLNNIHLVDGAPVYGENCTHCMACICSCPTEAIEYKKRTVGKPRYYNSKSPEIDD